MAELWQVIRADLAANANNSKGRVVLVAYRLARHARGQGPVRIWAVPMLVMYRLVVDWVMGIDLPPMVQAGPGLRIWHGSGLVVHDSVRLGADVTLRHGVTLGALGDADEGVGPIVGDRVSFGAGAIVLGPRHIGDDAVVGAGAVVVSDVEAGATVVGNPARVIAHTGGSRPPVDPSTDATSAT